MFERLFSWAFYLPAAVFLSPSAYAIHVQFNSIYQFWIHTETIPKLGPLEYIICTPSHHRVHHGANRYCIDKNYGGTLIIWDRMFGTFAEENEEIVYGLTHNINTFNPWTIQTHHFTHIWNLVKTLPGLGNKLSAVFKGPGWMPGKPRLGDPEDIPDTHAPVSKFNSVVPRPLIVYAVLHSVVSYFASLPMMTHGPNLGSGTFIIGLVMICAQYHTVGLIFNRSAVARLHEFHRCVFMVVLATYALYRYPTLLQPFIPDFVNAPIDQINASIVGLYALSAASLGVVGPWGDHVKSA